MDCVFCKIIDESISSDKVLEGETWLAFRDLNPQAPQHVLVIPKEHVAELNDAENPQLLADLLLACKEVARVLNLSEGYRVVNNLGVHGGQTVFHLHFHVLGGRQLSWPPG